MDFNEAHLQLDGWRSDWANAPRDKDKDKGQHGQDPRFLVRMKDGSVTTGYFYWYVEGGEPGFKSVAFWALHDEIRDEPLDEDGLPEDTGLMWRPMPSGPWAEQPSNFEKVGAFFRKFGLKTADEQQPHIPEQSTVEFRFGHLQEELDELGLAYEARDLVTMADALADLVYLAYGTAHTMGIPLDRVIDAVHAKNMTKVRAQTASESKRGSQLDVVKPPGFVGPEAEIAQILEDHANGR
jgi:predicted HAD superfamily Cof-like phosphohydrolase